MCASASLHFIVGRGFSDTSLSLGPARAVHEEASAGFPQLCLLRCCSEREWLGLFVCGPGDLAAISKSNCQNKPKFAAFMRSSQLRGRGLIHIQPFFFYCPNVSSAEFPVPIFQVQTTDSTAAEIRYFHIHNVFFFFPIKALTDLCSLPSWLHWTHRLVTFAWRNLSFPLCTSEGAFSFNLSSL